MSKLLKEKLKRSSRYSMSPLLPKRKCEGASSFHSPVKIDLQLMGEKSATVTVKNENDDIHIENRTESLHNTCQMASNSCENVSPLKRLCTEFSGAAEESETCSKGNISFSDSETTPSKNVKIVPKDLGRDNKQNLKEEKVRLETSVCAKEEKLRKLKLVKMYRSKNNMEELQSLIDKWRTVAQEALCDLVELNTEREMSLSELVNYFNLDHKLLGFNAEDGTFSPT